MCKTPFDLVSLEIRSLPSDSHLSTVTPCFPTVTSVPGGSVPAGAFRVGIAAGAEREVVAVRLACEELCGR
jgi:hypothetical protein